MTVMKAAAALLGALICLANAQLSTSVELETLVWYDQKFATKVGSDDLGPFVKKLINSLNVRLIAEYKNISVQLVLVGLEELQDSLKVKIASYDKPDRIYPFGTVSKMWHYFMDNTTTGNVSLADIVMYLSGEHIVTYFPEDKRYCRSFAFYGTICTQNKGLVTSIYNREFSQVADIMQSLKRLLGSRESGGVPNHLPKQMRENKDCATRHFEALYPGVTDLPGERLDGNQYCQNYSDKRTDFSLCETKAEGCEFRCCLRNDRREYRSTGAPDGYACDGHGKICIADKCVTGEAKDFKARSSSKPQKKKKKKKDKKPKNSSKSSE